MNNVSVSVYGDSLLQGVLFDGSREKYYLNKGFADKIAQKLNININNHSRFGMTTEKAAGFFERNLINDEANAVILEYGGNDCNYNWETVAEKPFEEHLPYVPLEVFEKNIESMILCAKAKNKRVILTTLPPISPQKYFNFITRKGLSKENILQWLGEKEHIYRHHERYSSALVRLSKKHDVMLADLRDFFLRQKSCESLLCDDGIHPNEDGQLVIQNAFSAFYDTIC